MRFALFHLVRVAMCLSRYYNHRILLRYIWVYNEWEREKEIDRQRRVLTIWCARVSRIITNDKSQSQSQLVTEWQSHHRWMRWMCPVTRPANASLAWLPSNCPKLLASFVFSSYRVLLAAYIPCHFCPFSLTHSLCVAYNSESFHVKFRSTSFHYTFALIFHENIFSQVCACNLPDFSRFENILDILQNIYIASHILKFESNFFFL